MRITPHASPSLACLVEWAVGSVYGVPSGLIETNFDLMKRRQFAKAQHAGPTRGWKGGAGRPPGDWPVY